MFYLRNTTLAGSEQLYEMKQHKNNTVKKQFKQKQN